MWILGVVFDIENIKTKIDELDTQTTESSFWDDTNQAQKLIATLNEYKNTYESYMSLQKVYDDMMLVIELLDQEGDPSLQDELGGMYNQFLIGLDEMTVRTLLSETYDKSNAIVTLHSGAGGTEACDWVEMLLRMYLHWSENHGYKVEILDQLEGEEAGIKSVTFNVIGCNAYGYLKAEKGVHRLVRISPFDSNKRRHTSFASCDVMPEIEDDVTIEIKEEDLKIDTYRAGGAGGQHVNRTDSAVRITHIPTGIVTQCQNERSQLQNKAVCMKVIRAKLYELEIEKQRKNLKDIQGELTDIGWGSQIRSYVFHPYNLVKDHRTDTETGNVNAVMDGEIDKFIHSYLRGNK